jgi:hypothetical protein
LLLPVKLEPVIRPRKPCALAGLLGSLLPKAELTVRIELAPTVAPAPTALAVLVIDTLLAAMLLVTILPEKVTLFGKLTEIVPAEVTGLLATTN